MEQPMFTIKQVTENGSVYLWPATRARIIGQGLIEPGQRGIEDAPKVLEFESEDGIAMSINSGTAYIMNSTGRTVQTVHFPFHNEG